MRCLLLIVGLTISCGSCSEDVASFDGGPRQDAGDTSPSDGGCAFTSDSLILPDVRVTGALRTSMGCIYDDATPLFEDGTIDLALANSYILALNVENELPDLLFIDKVVAVPKINNSCQPPIEVELATSVSPMGSSAAIVTILDTAAIEALDVGSLNLSVAVEGTTQSGVRVGSTQFEFPILVCDSCLQTILGSCSATLPPYDVYCLQGQDEATDCCLDASGQPICPPPQ